MASNLWVRYGSIVLVSSFAYGCSNADKKSDDGRLDSGSTETLDDTGDTDIFGECGDGVVNSPNEECDDGDNNANVPDACRTDCLLPKCGDGILDSEEECDDNNLWNIDGCDETCVVETGEFEVEPNNTTMNATPLSRSGTIRGMLWESDEDCFTFEFEDNDYIELIINPSQEECSHLMMINTYEDGVEVSNDVSGDGTCTSLDPLNDPSARYLPDTDTTEVTYCFEGLFGTAVEEYTLQWETHSDSCTLIDPVLTLSEDVDEDTFANNCDDDDDDDGLLDVQDNCPLVPNNGVMEYLPDEDGFFRTWLLTPAFQVSGITTTGCLPLPELLYDATTVNPTLTENMLDVNEAPVQWSLYNSSINRIDFNTIEPLEDTPAPREIFAGIWVYSSTYRAVNALLGSDDGGRVWVNGTLIGEHQNCHSATIDDYSYPTTLNAGWNIVLVQIRDGGGGWDMYFRFSENGIPVTDLELSPVSTGTFVDYQTDSDGDGVGDQCDLFD